MTIQKGLKTEIFSPILKGSGEGRRKKKQQQKLCFNSQLQGFFPKHLIQNYISITCMSTCL